MRKKKFIRIICFIVIGLVGIQMINNNNSFLSNDEKDIILDITAAGDFAEDGSSIDKLAENSNDIIKGEVISTRTWMDDSCTIYTDYTVKVKEVYAGAIDDSEIVISDFGGYIPAEEYFKYQTDPKALEFKKEAKKNSYVKYTFEGAWLPKVGEEYVWFLSEQIWNGKVVYNPQNTYQGVFEIDGSNLERYNAGEKDVETNIKIKKVKNDISKKVKKRGKKK